jgi:hypothetical protein
VRVRGTCCPVHVCSTRDTEQDARQTVALGYSAFCPLFTREEWAGFDHALDLYFWYGSAFGSPVARVQGVGYVQELVARLTHTPIGKCVL